MHDYMYYYIHRAFKFVRFLAYRVLHSATGGGGAGRVSSSTSSPTVRNGEAVFTSWGAAAANEIVAYKSNFSIESM